VKILVTGATGFVGRQLIPALIEAGHQVQAGTRHPENYDGPGTPVRFDLLDESTLDQALEDCEVLYYLVHSMETPGSFAEADRRAAIAVRDAVKARGIRVIYLGGLGDVHESAKRSTHLRSRHEVGALLRDGADTVELRAAVVVGVGSAGFEIMRQLVDRLPFMVCPRWVTTLSQPIGINDAVRYLVGAIDIPAGSYEIGGADVLTYETMMRTYARLTGRHRLIVKVPILSPRLSSHWIGLITDQSPAVARPLADGLAVEVVVHDDTIRSLIPFEPEGFTAMMQRALADEGTTTADGVGATGG
jgi:uncharacterized protein YbjT (DUF2867 family)